MYAMVQCENLTNSVSHSHRPTTVKSQTVVRSNFFFCIFITNVLHKFNVLCNWGLLLVNLYGYLMVIALLFFFQVLRTEQFFREKLASCSRFAFSIVFAFVKWISSDS